MKFKTLAVIGCITAVSVGILSLPLSLFADTPKRYHQHLEAAEKEPCTRCDGSELCTHLPLMVINTDEPIPGAGLLDENGHRIGFTAANDGSDRISAVMSVRDSETEYNHPSDEPDIKSNIIIHARGNSSRYFDKLNYRIKLVDENGKNNPQSLMGMDSHHEWALHGPFLDKTLIRNYMWYNIAGSIMSYAPNVRFCELIINGEYEGIYVLTELIGAGYKGEGRLNLSVNGKRNTYTGYLLRLDRYDDSYEDWLRSLSTYAMRNDPDLKLEVEYPGASKLTPELKNSIKTDFSAFEKALYSYDYNSKKYGYRSRVDINSFADYLILNEITVNYDAGSYSTYIYKDINGKFKMCVWDFNNSCDNYQEGSWMTVQHFSLHNKLWFIMMMRDDYFTEKVIKRYRELRKTYLSEEYLLNYIVYRRCC